MTRLIVDDGGTRRAFKLSEGRLTVGSGADATLRLSAEGVAEVHADLVVSEGGVRLCPRPGVAAPRVAGVLAEHEVELDHDAPVEIGGATLTVQHDEAPARPEAPPGAPVRRRSAGAGRSGSRSRSRSGSRSKGSRSTGSRAPGQAGALRRSPPPRSGLPGWALALIVLVIAGLAIVFVPKLLTTPPPAEQSVQGSLMVAREALATGNLEMARQRVEGIRTAGLDATTLALYEEVRAEYDAAVAESELALHNMRGNIYLQQQLKNFESNYLRGEAQRPQVRVFLKRCAEFRERWPQHPDLDWVVRMEERFTPLADLDAPLTYEDIAFEAKTLTWANPRDYRTAIPLVRRFADEEASVDDRPKALALLDELVAQRNEWFDDRMQQARYEFDKGNEGQSVEWLRILIVYTGDPTMSERAARELVLFEGLEGWLEAYKEQKPQKYAELAQNSIIADYIREHDIE